MAFISNGKKGSKRIMAYDTKTSYKVSKGSTKVSIPKAPSPSKALKLPRFR